MTQSLEGPFGGTDILVDNAVHAILKPMAEVTEEEFITVNVVSPGPTDAPRSAPGRPSSSRTWRG
ncbi:MAG TPA: hypothetical protein VFV01_23890 [Spirillospora sp.]|nr:hypothetical protein [Spirillospora sp.]